MTKLSDEQKQTLARQPGRPIPVEDPETHARYVIVPMNAFEQMQRAMTYDGSEITVEEMMAAAQQYVDDPEGWGAAGMEVYDNYQPPQYDPPRSES